MSPHESALEATQPLDAVRELDREALRKLEEVIFNWQQIAVHELQRRIEIRQ